MDRVPTALSQCVQYLSLTLQGELELWCFRVYCVRAGTHQQRRSAHDKTRARALDCAPGSARRQQPLPAPPSAAVKYVRLRVHIPLPLPCSHLPSSRQALLSALLRRLGSSKCFKCFNS